MSRAIGETMIVAIAAGSNPDFTLNPLVPIQTVVRIETMLHNSRTSSGHPRPLN